MNTPKNREQWLNVAAENILTDLFQDLPQFPAQGMPRYRISVGYPPNTRPAETSKILGCCISPEASADSTAEIFITPSTADSTKVVLTLIHELIHALDGNQSGHKGRFAAIARMVGFETPLTALNPSSDLVQYAVLLVAELGDLPHASIDLAQTGKKKQKSRMIKVSCPACGYNHRASQKNIDLISIATCPACQQVNLQTESK